MEREKRVYRRFDVSTAIEFSFGKEEYVLAAGLNISMGGFGFVTDYPLDPYSQIIVHLTLPGSGGDESMGAEALVLHCRQEGQRWIIGAKFTYFKPGDEEKLAKFLEIEEKA